MTLETLPHTLSLAARYNLSEMQAEEAWRMFGAAVLVMPGRSPVELPFGDYLITRFWAEPRDEGNRTSIVAVPRPA